VKKLQEQFSEATSKIRSEAGALEAGIRAADEARRFLQAQPRPEGVQRQIGQLIERRERVSEAMERFRSANMYGNVSGNRTAKQYADNIAGIATCEAEIKEISDEEGRLEESCFA
jgi:hypothetical protein